MFPPAQSMVPHLFDANAFNYYIMLPPHNKKNQLLKMYTIRTPRKEPFNSLGGEKIKEDFQEEMTCELNFER